MFMKYEMCMFLLHIKFVKIIFNCKFYFIIGGSNMPVVMYPIKLSFYIYIYIYTEYFRIRDTTGKKSDS